MLNVSTISEFRIGFYEIQYSFPDDDYYPPPYPYYNDTVFPDLDIPEINESKNESEIFLNLTLTNDTYHNWYDSIERIERYPIEFEVTKEELDLINPEISKLFNKSAWFTALKYYGPLKDLKEDLEANILCFENKK